MFSTEGCEASWVENQTWQLKRLISSCTAVQTRPSPGKTPQVEASEDITNVCENWFNEVIQKYRILDFISDNIYFSS